MDVEVELNVVVKTVSRDFVSREEERVDRTEMMIRDGSKLKKARIRMSLRDDGQGRRIA